MQSVGHTAEGEQLGAGADAVGEPLELSSGGLLDLYSSSVGRMGERKATMQR